MNNKTIRSAVCLSAALIVHLQAETPSSNDLWDITAGNVVVTNSPLETPSGNLSAYDPANMFGATNGTFIEGALGRVIFSDLQPPGFVHFIEWRTPVPVTVRSFRLFAEGDPNGYREFSQFRLLAKTNTSSTFDRTLYTFTPSHPFSYADAPNRLLLASSIRPVTAQEFRAEFVNLGGPNNGPRILELDGFSEFIETRSTIRVSEIEICWDTSQGVQYQVEYQTAISPGAWLPLGAIVDGDGTRMCVTDPLKPDSPSRFYRVRPLE